MAATPRRSRRSGPMRCACLAAMALQALLAGPTSVAAQAVAVLRAEAHTAGDSAPLALHIERSSPGQTLVPPWPAPHIDWMLVRAAGEQHNLHYPAADESDGTVRTIAPIAAGMHMIAIDLAPRLEQIPSASLREFLATRLGEGTLPAGWRGSLPEGLLTVRRIESAKLLVRVGTGEHPSAGSATTQGKTGQQVEIRLQADPTLVPVAHDLPVKVYLPGVTAGATRVLATHGESGATRSFRTDSGGRGAFTLGRQGPWLFEVHYARPLPDDDDADWEIFSATLSFAVPYGDADEESDR